MPSHTYDLNDALRARWAVARNRAPGLRAPGRFAAVCLPVPRGRAGRRARRQSADAGPIDVREMIATTSIEDLNRTAETYFASLTDWNHHLAKPFNNPDETPTLLLDVAMLLQGPRLTAGTRVLEFGAGTGWLSRFLTQPGCRVTLLDVSPTAPRIARERYDPHPGIGTRTSPVFLPFDGRRIIARRQRRPHCQLHAFHHAANPDAILAEFGALAPEVSPPSEPGPRHSSGRSQFEMHLRRGQVT